MLTTTLYLDFAAGIGFTSGAANVLSTTFGAVRDIVGSGIHGNGTGTDLTNLQLPASTPLHLRPLNYDFNGAGIDNSDVVDLVAAVLPIIKRALEPFDINVEIVNALSAGSSLAGVGSTFDANDAAPYGHHDAYVFIGDAQ